MKFKLIFAWYDLWVGFFWDAKKRRLYFFPIPMIGCWVEFSDRRPRPETDPLDEGCRSGPDGRHSFKTVSETWDSERRECEHCGESYTIYDDEMK